MRLQQHNLGTKGLQAISLSVTCFCFVTFRFSLQMPVGRKEKRILVMVHKLLHSLKIETVVWQEHFIPR
jgi:hypothetical protein